MEVHFPTSRYFSPLLIINELGILIDLIVVEQKLNARSKINSV